ncbi:uncharacterized protein LOC119665172 [Teleopsis dalmanni]|uniref:uncharacterized protein LOC119665172 n=1 Tax=Teleopsis dalmanni TaxID=139649 RepID=UPI0018CE67C1|nr:uncharacterized protein LOC119665172 [Teleopsis dalmanni]
MEKYPDIAKGICNKARSRPTWEKIAVELNSLGPPIKTWDKWVKLKQKKIAANTAQFKLTGGGPSLVQTLSPMEEAIDNLVDLNQSTDPKGFELGLPNEVNNFEIVEEQNAENGGAESEDEVYLPPTSKKRKKVASNQTRLELLKAQTNAQELFYKDVSRRLESTENLLKN